jgi:type I restriction enzyme M protein
LRPAGDTPHGRWRAFSRDELLKRDKASLDLFWLKDATMTDLDNLPEPEILMSEIMENLEAAIEQFSAANRV